MADSTTKKTSLSANSRSKKTSGFASIGSLFADYAVPEDKGYITREFQDYGYRLALELNDLSHKSLYIKMAKTVDRVILEKARSFVKDADHARSKAKLFMWKVRELKQAPAKGLA